MSLSPGESATFVFLVNFRFALRRRACPPHARPSSSESRVADSHSRVRRRVCRATANDPRRYRRRLREKREEPRRAATLFDRLTNPSPSINRLAASVVAAVEAMVVVATFLLPLFIPFVGSDSLLTTLVSATSRMCTIRVRLHEDFRLHVCADSRRRRAETDVSSLQNSRAEDNKSKRYARIRRNEIFCELQIKDFRKSCQNHAFHLVTLIFTFLFSFSAFS